VGVYQYIMLYLSGLARFNSF